MQTQTIKGYNVTAEGYYGNFGGAYIPELLYKNVKELTDNYLKISEDPSFKKELDLLLRDYVGRPTPLYFAKNLSEKYKAQIYLKREDLNHTGSHKINNALGQALLAKKLGKQKVIAETGAGQHGVATATACALLGLECTVFMGEVDILRQAPNVARMKMLGAKIIPATSGTKTLKDATNEAIRYWINNTDSYYIIGSVVGPHPYPDLVTRFQSIISKEIKKQLVSLVGKEDPDYVIACIGGGSNAAGAFYSFIGNGVTNLIGVEAEGKGISTGHTAATLKVGSAGIIHGSKTFLMQSNDGQITEPYSISAGLDYPGIGPLHAYLCETKQATYLSATDEESLIAAFELMKLEGIIPALESAHAFAALNKIEFNPKDVIVINLSGRGDKDLDTYLKHSN
jgi:tryptophan synthase beta chain